MESSSTDNPGGGPQVDQRHLGLWGATGVGVGAIVGGGILALAGSALAATGPSAIIAFALNGVIAILTALSFAEMSSKFPESGGMYTFAKKVLSIEAAFSIGWVVWFASIAAAALYAIGFAYFALIIIHDLWQSCDSEVPAWLSWPSVEIAVAVVTTLLLSLRLMLKPAGGGPWVNIGKVLVFGVLILGGCFAVGHKSMSDLAASMRPFFAGGTRGLWIAMGYTFIALQGFDLIAAVGGEVRDPARNVPRAMLLSLAIALAVYLPLLFIVSVIGTQDGESIGELAARDPETVIAIVASRYLGSFGYWLVIVAAVLATFSALQANLFAASRIAQAMARDRTLPAPLRRISSSRGTPIVAIVVTGVIIAALMLVLSDVSTAGTASSLIFLVTFALAHWIAILIRQRSTERPPPFRVPLFPIVPVIGGIACVTLALYQSLMVPLAGLVACIWLLIGGALFLTLFARRARVHDAASAAIDPELSQLRGYSPTVLVPVANPQNTHTLISVGHMLIPRGLGRLMALTVIPMRDNWSPEDDPAPIVRAEPVVRKAIAAGVRLGINVESMITVARDPVAEITRVANQTRCQYVVLGLSEISEETAGSHSERLIGAINTDVVVVRAPGEWKLADVSRVLILAAGRGAHDTLRASLLGSLLRTGRRGVTYLRVVPENTPAETIVRIRRELTRLASDEASLGSEIEILKGEDPVSTAANLCHASDLVILGVQRLGPRQKLFGRFTRQLAEATHCPLVVISRKG